jgi:predicted thioesterase
MEHTITTGIIGEETMIVEKKDTAAALGSGLAEVYATPAMVAFMENTAYKSIEAHLPEGYSSVGTEINVQHLKATLPASKVTCKSVITKVEGKKIHFEIEAQDEKGIIGKSEHIRYIIHSETFLSRLSE